MLTIMGNFNFSGSGGSFTHVIGYPNSVHLPSITSLLNRVEKLTGIPLFTPCFTPVPFNRSRGRERRQSFGSSATGSTMRAVRIDNSPVVKRNHCHVLRNLCQGHLS